MRTQDKSLRISEIIRDWSNYGSLNSLNVMVLFR
jgi:hypothetical protein